MISGHDAGIIVEVLLLRHDGVHVLLGLDHVALDLGREPRGLRKLGSAKSVQRPVLEEALPPTCHPMID